MKRRRTLLERRAILLQRLRRTDAEIVVRRRKDEQRLRFALGDAALRLCEADAAMMTALRALLRESDQARLDSLLSHRKEQADASQTTPKSEAKTPGNDDADPQSTSSGSAATGT